MIFIQAKHKENVLLIRKLFEEYANSLDFDLDFQNFHKELSDLPGEYSLPNGALVLAILENEAAGCVGLRKIDKDICEMKRLYVRPEFRGRNVGKGLAERIIKEAYKMGYRYMRLDTINTMKEAVKLYENLGFQQIEPYTYNPIEGAVFMELELNNLLCLGEKY
ncbi:GNAT family N-acetyltransferase [Clostridiaceae bacterium 35-E11]